jgi:hypothetical protein
MEALQSTAAARPLWNKGKLVGQKTPFKLKEIWAIRVRLRKTASLFPKTTTLSWRRLQSISRKMVSS